MQRICLSLVLGLVLVGAAEAARPTKYQVTVNVSAGGSVTSSTGGISCPSTCTASVKSGTAITFTASPETGATFLGFGDACVGSGTAVTCSLTVNADTTVSATFERSGGGGPTVSELQARIVELEALVANLEAALNGIDELLVGISRVDDPFTGVPTLYFTGMNVQIRSGSGFTSGTVNGAGNLILGYNEYSLAVPDDRSGSHNLVIGGNHTYSSYAGIVSGSNNAITNYWANVIGGYDQEASGETSAIVGGYGNSATGHMSVIIAGAGNQTFGEASAVVGGTRNYSAGQFATTIGGTQNSTTGKLDTTIGGDNVTCDDGSGNTFQAITCGEGTLSSVD